MLHEININKPSSYGGGPPCMEPPICVYTVYVGFGWFWKLPWKTGASRSQSAISNQWIGLKKIWQETSGNQCCYHQWGFWDFPIRYSGSEALVVGAIGVVVATPAFLPVSAILVIVATMNMIPIACTTRWTCSTDFECHTPPQPKKGLHIHPNSRPRRNVHETSHHLWRTPRHLEFPLNVHFIGGTTGNELVEVCIILVYTCGFQESGPVFPHLPCHLKTASALRQAAMMMVVVVVVVVPFIGDCSRSFQPNRLGQGFHGCWRGSWHVLTTGIPFSW